MTMACERTNPHLSPRWVVRNEAGATIGGFVHHYQTYRFIREELSNV